MDKELVRVDHLKKYFSLGGGGLFSGEERSVKAVDDVSFTMREGEVLGLVGESGCGKSTMARLLLALVKPTAGQIWFDGEDITSLEQEQVRLLRLKMQMVFQDPYGSLNPRMTAGDTIGYPMRVHKLLSPGEIPARVIELLEMVGLSRLHIKRLPHQLSGGQRQRVGIARALSVNPKLIIADEPVSSMDLSAQAQVLNLFKELQQNLGISYLFITHDLNVAEYMCDRIIVMYAGKIAEMADCEQIYEAPKHPYTEALLSAAVLGKWLGSSQEIILEGDPPSRDDPPPGCRFHTRCPYAMPICREVEPLLLPTDVDHLAACHLLTDGNGRAEPDLQPEGADSALPSGERVV